MKPKEPIFIHRYELSPEERKALLLCTRITQSILKDLLNRYDKSNPNYNAICELSTNIITARNKLKAE